MNQHEQIIYLLGYIKATIEWLSLTASQDKSLEVFELLIDFEQYFNQEIKKIFS